MAGLIAGRRLSREIQLRLGYFRFGTVRVPAWSISYRGIMAQTDPRLHQAMAQALHGELANPGIRLIYTNALPLTDPIYRLLVSLPGPGRMSLAFPAEPHMMIRFEKNLEQTIARLGASVRSQIRRTVKKNRQTGYTMRVYASPGEVESYFTDAESVARKTYQRALRVGFTVSPLHRRQANLAAQKGWFRGYILYDGGRPIAFEEDYTYGHHCFNPYVGYDPAYRSSNPGTLLTIKAWEDLISHTETRVYDFGLGDGVYKRRLADVCLDERELMLFRRTWSNHLLRVVLAINFALNQNLRHLLDYLGIYTKIKTFWRKRKVAAV
jgi:hypothetical protein